MNCAVIGCGAISRLHLQGIYAAGGKIAALCDSDISKAERAKTEYGHDCAVYADYRRMLDENKVDVVHICTPHYLHAEMACYALERNVNVLCEKPACISAEELRALEKAAKNSTAQLGFCLQNRYNESVQKVRELLAGHNISAAWGVVAWRRSGEYYTASDWRGKIKKEGGSALINQSIHTLDLLIYLIGMPETVMAVTHNLLHRAETDTEDMFYAVFQGRGRSFQLFGTTTAGADFPASISIAADGLRCTFDDKHLIVNGKVFPENRGGCPGKEVWGNGHAKLIGDFYGCLRENRKFGIGLEEASKSLKCVLATYGSDGKTIKIGG